MRLIIACTHTILTGTEHESCYMIRDPSLGMQVVDDVLDFTSTAEQLGKPRYQDIASGNLTAPTLFAMKKCPELRGLIESEFIEEGSVERAVALIEQHHGAQLSCS